MIVRKAAQAAGIPLAHIVLASASPIRQEMLRCAGVAVDVEPASLDESEMKVALRTAGASAAQAAETLAELKARKISLRHAHALVVGVDQLLECEGAWPDKPVTLDDARAQLEWLRGRQHVLVSAVAVIQDGTRLWHHTDQAVLTMRLFSDEFLAFYLLAEGPALLGSVGGYRLEGLGPQLFTHIQGDYFTILGLPLLPLLSFLRERGALLA